MKIEISGDNELELTTDLLKWLDNEGINGVIFTQEKGKIRSGTMGFDLLPIIIASTPIITAVADSSVLVEIIKSIRAWFITRKTSATIKFTDVLGNTVELCLNDFDDVKKIVERLTQNNNRSSLGA